MLHAVTVSVLQLSSEMEEEDDEEDEDRDGDSDEVDCEEQVLSKELTRSCFGDGRGWLGIGCATAVCSWSSFDMFMIVRLIGGECVVYLILIVFMLKLCVGDAREA